ncbi:MAG: hypothetical protein CL927_07480 [Deltaproteobacteria bacterium]|nr:hypothetical protein [Deltaproteobacteria bacterium]HCH64981.1 hypothetical protein [Deltaproteobacteria bacterium]
MKPLSRRSVLQAGAGLALAGPRVARAQSSGAPKRLLLISHCHGWNAETWKLRPDGATDSDPFQLDLTTLPEADWSAGLAPLYRHRQHLVALDGLTLLTAESDGGGNRHDRGFIHAWTGNWADFSGSDSRSTSASIDQLVAAAIARPDRLPSLELSVDGPGEVGRPVSYAASGARLPVANTPEAAWTRLFGLSSSPDPLVLRQQDAIAAAVNELDILGARLGAHGQARLNSEARHLTGLSTRIAGLADLSCPIVPERVATPSAFDDRFDAMSDLIAAAFACDLTRVISLSLGELPTADFGGETIADDVHKGIAHGVFDDPAKGTAMANYLTTHTAQVARLVDLLAATPDPAGGSLLDHTLVVWGSELGNSWHGYQHYLPVLIGGSWAFQTGRYHHWPHTTPAPVTVHPSIHPDGEVPLGGLPHQKMLVSVAQAMGLSVDHVGIPHFQSRSGNLIDASGTLNGLT